MQSEPFTQILQNMIDRFVTDLLTWYDQNKRDYLFWRNTKNPYYILVSEMMLQKTTVKQVQNLIHKFIECFPTPKELAEASVEEIKSIITPLGMEHRRAVRFKQWAGIVNKKYSSHIPDSEKDLISLPGVGRYMANSVLCLAFNKEVPLLDTNIVRILERVFNIKSSKARARTDSKYWDFVRGITPSGKSRDFNLALLDHGALVCTAKKPKCITCSLNEICVTYKKKLV